ncbi:MAG: CCA tRNA nucleotidyltransferase [Dehalococcoidales bacterium]|nr:CCA tRNA nucleotidyltransferase [Dehalococcoidales bacterium]
MANINLSKLLGEQLPVDIINFMKKAGEAAEKRQQRLYVVGGVVRDLLLGRCNTDLDLVVEGDAIKLAHAIAASKKAKATVHTRFGTANLKWANRSVDFITARAETYARPGALPTVRPGAISDDLARRDFTVNAMAIELNPRHYGEVIDPFGGRQDLDKKLIRILHKKSFSDDATRIWRAIRYEQRLDFKIEPETLRLLKWNIKMLKAVSGDRIRHELELVLKEETPEKQLARAGGLGVLAALHPALKADDWLAETFAAVREKNLPEPAQSRLYLALLCYRLNEAELEQLMKYLRLPKTTAQVLQDTLAIKDKTKELAAPGLAPSVVYRLLHVYNAAAYIANSIGADSETAAEHIELYLNVLRHVKPALSGKDLEKLGVTRGPRIKEVLQKLREARLDGKVASKEGEREIVRKHIKSL